MSEAEDRLALARGESVSHLRKKFTFEQIELCPRRFHKCLPDLRTVDVRATGIDGDLAYVKLGDGHIFYSYVSRSNHQKEYNYIADTIPSCITAETYLAAIDVVQRYISDCMWPPAWMIPPSGGNVIELGAYLGHKAIRFAEEFAGEFGKVLAVEMIPENVKILKKNIIANNLEDKIDVAVVGVWDKREKREIFSKGRQRNAISAISKLDDGLRVDVNTDTLDNIIHEWGVEHVDLVFMTVNGAEVEALSGFSPHRHQVNSFYIIAPYERVEGSNALICHKMLSDKGYKLHSQENDLRVVATRC